MQNAFPDASEESRHALSLPALGVGGAAGTCGWPTCSERGEQWLSLTACDYKFFLAQAAHTKTLGLQQKKGQSKPSSPSYYKKSLVPAGAFAFITIVRAGENKNNSRHSKINLRSISPRLSQEIKTVDHTGRGVCSHAQREECGPTDVPGMHMEVPSAFPMGRKKNKSAFPMFAVGDAGLFYLRYPWEPMPLQEAYLLSASNNWGGGGFWTILHPGEIGMGVGGGGWDGCNSQGTLRFPIRRKEWARGQGRGWGKPCSPWRIGCQTLGWV